MGAGALGLEEPLPPLPGGPWLPPSLRKLLLLGFLGGEWKARPLNLGGAEGSLEALLLTVWVRAGLGVRCLGEARVEGCCQACGRPHRTQAQAASATPQSLAAAPQSPGRTCAARTGSQRPRLSAA